ncbi:hypothetical protein FRC11_012886 [Ceratobasidium sp. 423]|nr:hypothetical protein FRC11_012886 [Ceratobasidium sp. 423]
MFVAIGLRLDYQEYLDCCAVIRAAVTDNIPSNADIAPGKALTWAHVGGTSRRAVCLQSQAIFSTFLGCEDETEEAPKDKAEPPPPRKTKKGEPQPGSEAEELEVQSPYLPRIEAPPSSKCKLNNPKPKSEVDKLEEDEPPVKHKTELAKKTNKPKETPDESVLSAKERARRKMRAPRTPTPEPEPKEIEPQQGEDEEEQPRSKSKRSKPLPEPEEEPEAVVPPKKDRKRLPPADEEQAESRTKRSKHDPAPSSSVPKPASDDYRPSTPDGNQVVRSYQMKVSIPAKGSIASRMRRGTGA